jgi:hypothetical protein
MMRFLRAALAAVLFLTWGSPAAFAADVKPLVNASGAVRPVHTGETVGVANGGTGATTLPACADTGGNHLNYSGGTWSCGTSGSGGSPGGSSGQLQYNNSGAFGGVPTVNGDGTLNTGTGALTVTKLNSVSPGSFFSGTDAANLTGTLSLSRLPSIGSGDVLGNSGASSATPSDTTLTALLDRALGSTQGIILYRGASAWAALGVGSSGNCLTSSGAGANPAWSSACNGTGGSVGPRQGSVTKPVVASFSWVNQSAASAVDGVTGIVMSDTTSSGTSENNSLLTQAAPGSFPYDVVAHVEHLSKSDAFFAAGIHLRNSSSGKFLALHIQARAQNSMFVEFDRFANPTTYNSTVAGPINFTQVVKWVRFNVTSTTVTAYVSPNGLDWYSVGTETISGYVGSIDTIGINIDPKTPFVWVVFDSFGTTLPS